MPSSTSEPSGLLQERLTIQTEAPRTILVSALTWALGLASVVTLTAHGYVTGDFVTIAGAVPSGYAGKVPIVVTGALAFTYPLTGPLTTPATGTITATYAQDTHGGRAGLAWRTLATIWAELLPMSTFERLQRQAIEDGLTCRFRVRSRGDLVAGLRAVWTPRWPAGSAPRTFVITGVEPAADPTDVALQCTQVTL